MAAPVDTGAAESSVAQSSSVPVASVSSVLSSESSVLSSRSEASSSEPSAPESSASSVPANDLPYSLTKIGCNDADDYSGRAITLFDGGNTFSGNFYQKDFSRAAFANLSRQGASDYTLSGGITTDASCNNRNIHTGTWLKKLVDTTEQHANGYSAQSLSGRLGDIDSIVLELRINSDLSDVPSQANLLERYAPIIGEQGVATLDNGQVNFGLTFGDPEANSSDIRAEVFITLDPAIYADQWVRVSIPKTALFYWQGANWEKTPVSAAQASAVTFTRFHMNPETLGNGAPQNRGVVVRNIYGYSQWESLGNKPEEDFKEMNISIRTLEIRYEPTSSEGVPAAPTSSSSSSVASSAASSSVASNLSDYFAAQKCGVEYSAMGNGGWAACYRVEGGFAACKTDMTAAAPTILTWKNGEKISDVMQLSTAYGYACALNAQGEAWCWGRSPGFGDVITATPSKLPIDEPLVNISAAQNAFCGTKLGGGAACVFARYDGPPYLPLPSGFESPVREPSGFSPLAVDVHMGYKLGVLVNDDGTGTVYRAGDAGVGTPLGINAIVAASGKRDIANNSDASGILLMTASGEVHAVGKSGTVKVSPPAAQNPVCNF